MSSYTAVSWRSLSIVTLLLLITGTVAGVTYDLSFVGIAVEETDLAVGDSISYQSNLVNLADGPHTDVTVRGMLIRNSDRNLVYDTQVASDIDLASRELVTVEGSETVPDAVPSGDYQWVLQAETKAGAPVAYMSESLSITNPQEIPSVSFGESGVYLLIERIQVGDGIVREYRQPTYGSSGETAIAGNPFDIRFSLTNDGEIDMDLTANINIVPTYATDGEPVESFEEELGTLAPGESSEYTLSSAIDEPGTYRVRTEIVDGSDTVRADGEVRLVIGGDGGSIVNVANHEDIYDEGDTIATNVSYVGPADGSTVVEDATLTMQVRQDNQVVVEDSHQIDRLPFNVEDYTFEMEAPRDLDEYTLRVVLGKGDVTYDTFTASYEELDPERVLTDDGTVRVQGECVDDGTCTQAEYNIGGCFDCRNVDESPEETSYFNEVDQNQLDEGTGTGTDDSAGLAPAWTWIAGFVLFMVVLAGVLSKKFKEEI